MPWHIPLLNDAPDLCIWDRLLDTCPPTSSKTISVNNLLMFFREFGENTPWKQYSYNDVDGNTWV